MAATRPPASKMLSATLAITGIEAHRLLTIGNYPVKARRLDALNPAFAKHRVAQGPGADPQPTRGLD